MSNTVRDLIRDAFIRSTVRGLGDTPDDLEVKDALSMLNEILDVLSQKDEFSTGDEAVVFENFCRLLYDSRLRVFWMYFNSHNFLTVFRFWTNNI